MDWFKGNYTGKPLFFIGNIYGFWWNFPQLRSTQAAITGTNHHDPSVHWDFGFTEPGTVRRDTEKSQKKEAFWKTYFQCPEFEDYDILTMVNYGEKMASYG